MNTVENPTSKRRPGFAFGLLLVLSVWLLISPWIVGYSTAPAFWNPIVAGTGMLLLALLRAGLPQVPWLWFINLLPGAWLVMAPFLFDYLRTGAFWNSLGVGIVALLVAGRTRGAVPGGNLR